MEDFNSASYSSPSQEADEACGRSCEHGNRRDMDKAVRQNPLRTRYAPRRGPNAVRTYSHNGKFALGAAVGQHAKRVGNSAQRETQIAKNTMASLMAAMSGEATKQMQTDAFEILADNFRTDAPDHFEIDAVQLRRNQQQQSSEHMIQLLDLHRQQTGADLAAQEHGIYTCGALVKLAKAAQDTLESPELATLDGPSEAEIKRIQSEIADTLNIAMGVIDEDVCGKSVVAKAPVHPDGLRAMVKSAASHSISRVAADHEAILEFGDKRVCMARWARGDCAGQMVIVDPTLTEGNTAGDLTLQVRVPRRNCLATPNRLDDVIDLQALLKKAKEEVEVIGVTPLTNHAHMLRPRKPTSAENWLKWRPNGVRLKNKNDPSAENQHIMRERNFMGAEEDSSGDDDPASRHETRVRRALEEAAARFDDGTPDASPRSGVSARSGGSPRFSAHGATAAHGSKSPRAWASPRGTASPRAGIFSTKHGGHQALDVVAMSCEMPWDARRQPGLEELDELVERVGFVMPEPGAAPTELANNVRRLSGYAVSGVGGTSSFMGGNSAARVGDVGSNIAATQSASIMEPETPLRSDGRKEASSQAASATLSDNWNTMLKITLGDGVPGEFEFHVAVPTVPASQQDEKRDDPTWKDVFMPLQPKQQQSWWRGLLFCGL